jgi:hypothetical protein
MDQQEAAWFEYIDLKRRCDAAFERFKELYLAEDKAAGLIDDRPRPDNVKIFPVHRSRPSSRVSGGAA